MLADWPSKYVYIYLQNRHQFVWLFQAYTVYDYITKPNFAYDFKTKVGL